MNDLDRILRALQRAERKQAAHAEKENNASTLARTDAEQLHHLRNASTHLMIADALSDIRADLESDE